MRKPIGDELDDKYDDKYFEWLDNQRLSGRVLPWQENPPRMPPVASIASGRPEVPPSTTRLAQVAACFITLALIAATAYLAGWMAWR